MERPPDRPAGPQRPAAQHRTAGPHRTAAPARPFDQTGGSEEFARLLAAEGDRGFKSLAVGQRVKGTVVAIGDAAVMVDVGQRSEAVVPLDQLRPEDLRSLQVGQRAEFLVSRIEGGIELAWALGARHLDHERLADAQQSGLPIEGKVTGENKGGFTVALGAARGFVPYSQMELGPAKPLADYQDHTLRFRVLEVRGRDVILSRTSLLREEQARTRRERLTQLEVGQELEVEVVRLERFGAFVDLGGGLNALVPISELAWSGQNEALAMLRTGVQLLVKLTAIETEGERPKIAASVRQVTSDPWLEVPNRFAEGQAVSGRVTRLAPFGAFVEIAPGIEALLHISQMKGEREIRSASAFCRVGDTLEVVISGVDAAARRIALSIDSGRDTQLDPETRARYLGASEQPTGSGLMAEALRKALANKQR